MARIRRSPLAGAEPLSPRRKWRAIMLATLLFVPGYWAIVAGAVSIAADDRTDAPNAAPLIAFGLALVPFVFVLLAFLSEHPRAAGNAVKAMGLALIVGIPVSAIAADAVTGIVAGVGAGGVVALRADLGHDWRTRAIAVLAVSVYVFILLRTVFAAGLLLAPALPLTAVGVADHLAERRKERRAASV